MADGSWDPSPTGGQLRTEVDLKIETSESRQLEESWDLENR